MELEAQIEHIDPDTAGVAIHGALRIGPDLQTLNYSLQQLVATGVTRIILDLSHCPYIDSAGLGTLLHTAGLLGERHGQLRLCCVNKRVEDLIVMTHTGALLHRDPDRQAAYASLP